MLAHSLRSLGYEVEEAQNGAEGLQALKAHPGIAAVLTDWNMPVMDGFTFIRRIRGNSHFANLPILVVSSDADPEKRRAARDAGASGHLMKPFTPLSISQCLSALRVLPASL